MAIGMLFEFPSLTQAQADAVMQDLNLGGKSPPGQILHFEGTVEGIFQAVDVWESQAAFDTFMQERLVPAFQKAGIRAEPQVKSFEVHNLLFGERA